MVVSTGIVRETVFKYAWFFFELLVRFSHLYLCSVWLAEHTCERQSFLGQGLAGNLGLFLEMHFSFTLRPSSTKLC